MIESVIFYIILILLLIYAVYVLFKLIFGYHTKTIEQECTCGKYDKCISKITIKSNISGISLSRDMKEFYKCGKVLKQLEACRKLSQNNAK